MSFAGAVFDEKFAPARRGSHANCETCSWTGDPRHSRQRGWGGQAMIGLIHQMKTEYLT
jgi:hypothetical protein